VAIVRLKTFNRDQKVKELFNMFKVPVADVSSQGYAAVPKLKLRLKPKSELIGGAAVPITNEHKTKELFEMFGLRL
jgi:hypothetical protein